MFQSMFALDISLLEKIIRPILIYFFLVLLLRIFGKRELAQLNPFDFVVLLSLSNTVQNAIIGNDNSVTGGMIGAVTLVSINFITVRVLRKNKALDKIVEGEPSNLIVDGKIIPKNLTKEDLTENDLMMVIRKQGFEHFQEIESCSLEPNGSFEIIAKKPLYADVQQQILLQEIKLLREEVQKLQKC